MLKLLIVGIIVILTTALLYIIDNKTSFGKQKSAIRQLVYGLIFGGLAILSTKLSNDVDGIAMNIRDSIPLCGALVLGGSVGIISSLIGGTHRFLSSFVQGADASYTYTQIACSLSCVLAGFFGAMLKRNLFKNRVPFFLWGAQIGIVSEVFHMLLLIITKFNDIETTFGIITSCATPMIIGCGLTVALTLGVINIIDLKDKKIRLDKRKNLARSFQIGLLISIFICFATTTSFTYFSEDSVAKKEATELLTLNLNDIIESEFNSTISDEQLKADLSYWRIGKNGGTCVMRANTDGKLETISYTYLDNKTEPNIAFTLSKENTLLKTKVNNNDNYLIYSSINDYYILVYVPVSEINFYPTVALYTTLFLEIIVFTTLFILIYTMINKLVVENIHKVNKSLKVITEGNLEEKVNVRGQKEFNHLSDDINKTVETLKHYIKEAESRIDKELALAKEIQYSALPLALHPFPDHQEFDLYASMDTAKEVGGDFYDFYLLDDNHLAITVADVSDKGIPAALFMMKSKTLLKSLLESTKSISKALEIANNKLCENNEADMFVTSWLGVLELSTGILKYTSAGHTTPLVSKNGKFSYLHNKPSFILGGLPNIKYSEYEIKLNQNDIIFLYTDGVTEATNKKNELYSENRLLDFINNNQFESMESLCHNIRKSIDSFVLDAPQFDDITMLALQYKGIKKMNEKTFEAKSENIDAITNFVLSTSPKMGKIKNKLCVVIDEITSNIIHYAYKDCSINNIIIVKTIEDDTSLKIQFIDFGQEFNPLKQKDADVKASIENRPIGGLGIFLVKKLMDDVSYEYSEGKNILTITAKY